MGFFKSLKSIFCTHDCIITGTISGDYYGQISDLTNTFEYNPFTQVRTSNEIKISGLLRWYEPLTWIKTKDGKMLLCVLADQMRKKFEMGYLKRNVIKNIELEKLWGKISETEWNKRAGKLRPTAKALIDLKGMTKVTDAYFKNGKYIGVAGFDKHIKTDNLRGGTLIVNLLCTKCGLAMQTFHDLSETKEMMFRHPYVEELLFKQGIIEKKKGKTYQCD